MEQTRIQNSPDQQVIGFAKVDTYPQIFLFFIQDFLNWWYVKMPLRHLRKFGRLSTVLDDNLSITLLVGTFFVPWHRDKSIMGYLFGILIRLLYLPIAISIYSITMIVSFVLILTWLLLPLVAIIFTVISIFR
ncbi:TPA: hypothetical protein GX533_00110 [Candidatus Dojkabacteria bacterium]|uniref:Uncharacterized protein n=1 Tax=Candidatus Dojkabacteria bacterium TaxID=2099670 RepID=A0A832QBS7_9BACT|nr:hypothetical protein [Candidatus Dojkabacteria bacterium]